MFAIGADSYFYSFPFASSYFLQLHVFDGPIAGINLEIKNYYY